jgi:cell division protein ZapA
VKKPIEVTIMGQKFMVKSESGDDYVIEIAKYVDRKINEVIQSTKAVASVNVALLAAMNIADEFRKYRNDKEGRIDKVEKKVKDMIELVDLQL